MNTEHADPDELALLWEAFGADSGGGPALGRQAMHAFEAEHGVLLPEPYRTFVAEIADGSPAGPPGSGLVPLAELPPDWGAGRPERVLREPFPLTATWVWEGEEPPPPEARGVELRQVFDHGSVVLGTDGCGM